MVYKPENPLVVQSNSSILLETDNKYFESARDALAQFAELITSPEHIHTYRITALSLWNAASAGLKAEAIIKLLEQYCKYDIPQNILVDVREYVSRYGRLKLIKEENTGNLILNSRDEYIITEILHNRSVELFLEGRLDKHRILVKGGMRGRVKQALIKIGYPVEDLAGYVDGARLEIELLEACRSGRPFVMREYQRDSIEVFYAKGASSGGSGVLVLPCGA
ncbi:MAG: helicase-associated domain-containing protein, partial [bacterium]